MTASESLSQVEGWLIFHALMTGYVPYGSRVLRDCDDASRLVAPRRHRLAMTVHSTEWMGSRSQL